MTICDACGDYGQILTLLRSNQAYEYAFACSLCAQGKRFPGLQLWSDSKLLAYRPVSFKPKSYNAAANVRARALAEMERLVSDSARDGDRSI